MSVTDPCVGKSVLAHKGSGIRRINQRMLRESKDVVYRKRATNARTCGKTVRGKRSHMRRRGEAYKVLQQGWSGHGRPQQQKQRRRRKSRAWTCCNALKLIFEKARACALTLEWWRGWATIPVSYTLRTGKDLLQGRRRLRVPKFGASLLRELRVRWCGPFTAKW